MMAAKYFLAVIGAAYLILAAWCALKPATTARSVGYDLKEGSGQSEYLVVYGGLQLGLGLVFLLPFVDSESTKFCLISCLLIHVILVFFRTVSFGLYRGISSTTYILAATEWLIALASLYFYWTFKN